MSNRQSAQKIKQQEYKLFDRIDGRHPWQKAMPNAYVPYAVRKRKNGKVAYFNFELAKEMGLIPKSHSNILNKKLEAKLLDTFALQIINEYDIAKNIKYPAKDIKPHKYMATRYLQLQHADKTGTTSGDGRSIWNGFFQKNSTQWDISSCGTGVTKLSPGSVEAKGKPIRTGSPTVSYGSGLAGVDEGISSAILSEIFHNQGLGTERVLAVLEFPGSTGITVRASKNLIRPSHIFNYLKQNDLQNLKASIDFFIERQIYNEDWNIRKPSRYQDLLENIAKKYAEFTAQLEDEYIFCWLDWDGDNMLATAGILDYGSVRQFGLFHHKYRYDDVDRYSTTITEQRKKCRYIVQTFAQAIDYILHGTKRDIKHFASSKATKIFDQAFLAQKDKNLLVKVGFNQKQQEKLLQKHPKLVKDFRKVFSWFERQKTKIGYRKVPDGINWNAIFCMRDILRELPKHFIHNESPIGPELFLEIIKSNYASKASLQVTAEKKAKITKFQKMYLALVKKASSDNSKKSFLEIIMRASQKNSYIPITGDGIIFVTDYLLKLKKRVPRNVFHAVVREVIDRQSLHDSSKPASKQSEKHFEPMIRIIRNNQYSI